MKKVINLLTVLVMVSVNVFTPFSYAEVESGAVVDIEGPVIEQPAIEELINETPEENKNDNISTSGSVLDIEKPEEPINPIDVIEPELPIEPEVGSGNVVSMSWLNSDIEDEHWTTELSGWNNIEEENNYYTGYISKLNNLEKEHTLNLLHSLTSEEIRWEWSYDWVKVEVYAQTWAFPSWTILSIVPITWDNDIIDIQDVLKEQKEIERTEKLIAFDISFLDKETKEELQPSTWTVQVTFNYEDNEELKQAEEDETQEVKVYHLNDKDEEWEKIEEIKDVIVEEAIINEEESEEWVMVVEAESFSVYTIVTQIREWVLKGINDQLDNFVYWSISIENPDQPWHGITVMDRNLWAGTNDISSSESYWYYYQWWNNYWFTTGCLDNVVSIDVDTSNYTYWTYYNKSFNKKWKWSADLWWDVTNTLIARQWPCPVWWHIPTKSDWDSMITYWNKSRGYENTRNDYGSLRVWVVAPEHVDEFFSDLHIPNAWHIDINQRYHYFLSYTTSNFYTQYYWYQNIWGINRFVSNALSYAYEWLPIRCFKNEYTPEQYRVTFHFNWIKWLVVEESVWQDWKVKEPSDSWLTGVVVKWYDNQNLSWNAFDFNSTITSNKDLYAKYECWDESLCKRTVTFETNEWSSVDPIQILAWLTIDIPEDPVKEWFTFVWWYEDENLKNKFDFSKSITKNITLYAGWWYTISFNTNSWSEKESIVVPWWVTQMYFSENKKYSHTQNIRDDGVKESDYGNRWDNSYIRWTDRTSYSYDAHVVSFPWTEALKVTVTFWWESNNCDWVIVRAWSHSTYYAESNYDTAINFDWMKKLWWGSYTSPSNTKTAITQWDAVTFSYRSDGSVVWDGYWYYAVIQGIFANFSFWENPTKEWQVFDWWYKENWEKWDEYTDVVTWDITLYAHWRDPEAILLPWKDFNKKIKDLANNSTSSSYSSYDYTIKNIVRVDSIPSWVETIEIQAEDSDLPIYAWYKKWTIYIYSEPDKIYLNSDSSYMFYYMYSLKNLDVNNLNTSKASDISYMFYYAQQLEDLNLSGWNIINVRDMNYMFWYCSSLKTLNLNGWDLSNNPSTSSMFNWLYALKNLSLRNWTIPEKLNNGFYSSFWLSNSNALETIDVSNWDLSRTTSLYQLFYDLYSLKSIIWLETWNTSNIESMYYLFAYCYNLENINISSWDTSKVTDMSYVFYYCKSLEELDLSRRNTSAVTTTYDMFYYCESLENLNLDNRDFSKNTSTSSMFYRTPELKNLWTKNWKLWTNINNLACNTSLWCQSDPVNYNKVKRIDVSWWIFSWTSLNSSFYNWNTLEQIDWLETWNTSGVTNMWSMFYKAYNIKHLDLSNWDTSNVTNMGAMFYWMSWLVELDLDSFDTSSLENTDSMFYNTSNLKTIYVSDKFTTNSITNSWNMFFWATSIEWWNRTTYDANHINAEYAKIDKPWTLWYFTNILDKPYNITYNLDGWIISWEKTIYTQRDTFTLKSPIKTWYTFLWWTWSNGDSPEALVNILSWTFSWDLVFNANWEINQYTITFDTDGWTEIAQIKQDYNTEVTAPDDPIKTWYSFTSWDKIIPNKMPAEDITITAQWEINQYTITFDTDGWTEIAQIKQDYNTEVTAPDDPIKTWYSFTSWDKIIPNKMPAEDITITAQWGINQYTITFDTDGWNKLSDMKLDYNAKITNLPTPIKECNVFIWWKDLPENMPAHNTTLKAMWNYTCSRSSWWGGGWNIKPEEDHGAAIQEPEKEDTKVIDEPNNQGDKESQEIEVKYNDKSSNEINENNDTNNIVSSEEVSHNDYTQEQIEAYTFAKSNWITTTSSIEKSRINTEITRIQMAKMLSNFAINVLWQEPDTSKWIVKFEDVTNKMDKQYDNAVTKSYQLWIMWQNVKDNEFRPNDEVTRAEFATALSRMLYNTDEWKYKWTSKYYEPHMAKLYNEWIITNTNPKLKEKRWYVMTMLMRSVNK